MRKACLRKYYILILFQTQYSVTIYNVYLLGKERQMVYMQKCMFSYVKVLQTAYPDSHYKAAFMIKLNRGQLSLMYVIC